MTQSKTKILFVFLFTLFVSAGCSTLVQMPQIQREVSSEEGLKAWTEVLKNHVNDQGQVDFKGLAKNPEALNAYVHYVSKVGPKSHPAMFPTQQAKLAHYINSYNALSMYNILDSGIPESLSGLKKVKFFYFKKFIIGGEKMSLYAYENDIIRKEGEERVHVALNCMSRGCPRLPKVPFTTAGLEAELTREAKRFFNEERNVRVDEKEKTVFLSEILDFFPDDFLKKAPSLIAYANKYHEGTKLPEDYEVDFIPYDWTVNSIPQNEKLSENSH